MTRELRKMELNTNTVMQVACLWLQTATWPRSYRSLLLYTGPDSPETRQDRCRLGSGPWA